MNPTGQPTTPTSIGNQVGQAVNTITGPMNFSNISNPIQGYQQANQAATQATANFPAYQANQAQGMMQQTNTPAASNQYSLDYNTFAQMLAQDPMGQKYMNPNQSTSPTFQTLPNGQQVPGVVSALPQLTSGNVGQSFQGFDNPLFAMGAANTQEGGILGTMNNLGNLITNNLGAMSNQLTQNSNNYSTQVQALENLANNYMGIANYNLSLAQAGMNASPLSGGLDMSTLSSMDTSSLSKSDVRKLYQQAWNGAMTTQQQNQIASAFKSRYGQTLNPAPLSQGETQTVSTTYNTLDTINNILNFLQSHKNAPSGVGGNIQNMLIHLGLGGTIDPQTRQYLADLTSLSGGGERQLIGGRLTGYLLSRLGVAFPTATNSPQQNISILTKLRREIVNDLSTYSQNAGYDNWAALPGGEYFQNQFGPQQYQAMFNQLKKSTKMSDNQIDQYLTEQGYLQGN